ncbi:MAG: carboxypeptidase-like regulatory domain-containing protein [Myxococcales bacterium]
MSISGALRDELGNPLRARAMGIEAFAIGDEAHPLRNQLTTDDAGRFALELPDTEHDYRLLATFAGDATHRGVRVERRVERARADVRLELRLPSESTLDLDAPNLMVDAIAESDAGGDGIAMRLSDEEGRTVASGVTGPDGRLSLRISPDSAGSPGPGLLRLESARDDRRAEAQTEARVVRRRAVFIEMRPDGEHFEAGSLLRVRGHVRTRVGPRDGVPVGLYAGESHLETVLTNTQGDFVAELWIDAAPGELAIQARTEADATGAYPAAETQLVVHIEPPQPVPVLWLVGASALLAGLLFLLGRARRERGELEPAANMENLGSSVHPARRHGRRDRHRINGRAVQARSDAPLAHASIQIVHEQAMGSCTLVSDAHGRFASPVLPAGRARMLVDAPGHVATQVELEIPHRGEWTSFVVRLESLRDRALSPFRRLTMRVLPSPRAWGIWTNREAREWLAQRAPAQQAMLGQLTADVERACYAREDPSEAEVAQIEQSSTLIEGSISTDNRRESAEETRAVR